MSRDVESWLAGLGLERHAAAFASNGIDLDLLPDLDNADLKDLGVARLADRKRLLKAIAGLAREKAGARAPPEAPAREAERRHLTVMFCDLVGSTALSAALDPEALIDVLRAYQEAAAEVVGRYDGQVAKHIGDGLLVYFGIPRAHEDDAQRAVAAGLGIVEAVAGLSRRLRAELGIDLSVRIGIHSGLVVAGEMGSGAAREEMAIVGQTPNLAARLQALAPPDGVVIGAATRRLLGGLFLYEDLGTHQLKGIARPVEAWRVIAERPSESRFEALNAAPGPMVGRKGEIALLLDRWGRARQGSGQAVLVGGEAGIGKSRVIAALRERIAEDPHTRVRCQCSPHFTTSALHPFIRQIEQAAGLLRGDAPEVAMARLERHLAACGPAARQAAPLFAKLLAIPLAGDGAGADLAPRRLKERTLQALLDRLCGLAARRPVLLVVEDAHWIDPSSEELVGAIIRRLAEAPILAVITHRPDYDPPWKGEPQVTPIALGRLGREEAEAMVRQVAAALPAETVERILARGDGVPLFVEELARSVVESGAPTAVPASLHDTLMARLDRTAMKEVAQTAAVLGRDFGLALLAEVAPLPPAALPAALDALVQSGLLFRRGDQPGEVFAFKHALVRDAAYESLLVASRRQLHARTAAALERAFPEVAAGQPELLAHHYEAAAVPERAIAEWRRAGAKAAAGSNYAEAERQLTHALDLLPLLAEDRRPLAELDLQMALGAIWRATRGTGSSLTQTCYDRARILCAEAGAEDRLLEVVYGQFICAFNRPRLPDAGRHAAEFMAIAQRRGDAAAQQVAHYLSGITAFLFGDFGRARRDLERCLEPGHGDAARMAFYSQGQLPGAAMMYLAWTLLALGDTQAARGLAVRSVESCRGGPAFQLAMAVANACCLWHMCGDTDAVEENLATLHDLTAERGIIVFHEMARLFEGWTLARRGAADAGIALMGEALGRLAATEQKVELPYSLAILAERCLAAGRLAEAGELLAEALRQAEATQERWYEAELHRLAGDLARAEGQEARAKAAFERALSVATKQSAHLWMQRAACSLERLRSGPQEPATGA